MLSADRNVPVGAAPLCDSLQRSTQARCHRLPLDDPISALRLGPVVGEAEEVPALRHVATSVCTAWRLREADQASLLRMQVEPEPAKACGERRVDPPRVVFVLAEDHEVVGVTDQARTPPSHGLHARCLRFAAGVAPVPRKTRFRLVDQPCPGGA